MRDSYSLSSIDGAVAELVRASISWQSSYLKVEGSNPGASVYVSIYCFVSVSLGLDITSLSVCRFASILIDCIETVTLS